MHADPSDPATSHAGPRPSGRGRRRAREAPPDGEIDLGPHADVESFARQILLRRLTDQPRTRADLAEQLASRGVPDDVAVRLLDRFTAVGLIDDAEYARSWARSRQRSRGLSGRVIAQELRRKGVDDELVRETVAEEIDADSEREAARALVRKKLRSMRGVEEPKRTQRLVGMLARKGYGSGVAYGVIREEIGAEAELDALDSL
ncbi:MAG: regulatory protein RecX [Nocardioidaceae bacterium]|nr:regulatory protein RecX [Nocardioidaceae bacterium]